MALLFYSLPFFREVVTHGNPLRHIISASCQASIGPSFGIITPLLSEKVW